jgi:hypothetical protein
MLEWLPNQKSDLKMIFRLPSENRLSYQIRQVISIGLDISASRRLDSPESTQARSDLSSSREVKGRSLVI